MDSIDKMGLFWRSNDSEEVLTGRLVFDPLDKGARLSLVGTFDHRAVSSDTGDPDTTIFGWLDNDKVTLSRCFSTGNWFRGPGAPSSGYYANEMFVGAHLEGPAEFDSVSVKFYGLETWVGATGISETSDKGIHVITLTPPDALSAPFLKGEVFLDHEWRTGGSKSISHAEVQCHPRLRIEYSKLHGTDEIQRDVSLLESLLTICTGAPLQLDSMILRRSDLFVEMINGEISPFLQPIEYLAPRLNHLPHDKRKKRHEHEMLLTFGELGGVNTIAHWLDSAHKIARCVNSLMSISRSRQMFAENKFMNVTYAAEAMHRTVANSGQYLDDDTFRSLLEVYIEHTPSEYHEWLNGRIRYANEPSLAKRLNEIAATLGDIAKPLIGDRRRWSNTISLIRNDLTHLGSDASGPGGGVLYYLTESVYAVCKLFILFNLGVSPEVLRRKVESMDAYSSRGRIASSIDKAREYLRASGLLN